MRLKDKTIQILSALIVLSCAGVPETPDPPKGNGSEYVYDEKASAIELIDALLDEGRPADALQLIYFRQERDGKESLGDREEKAYGDLHALLEEAVAGKDYRKAFSCIDSLETAGQATLLREQYDSLKMDYLKNLLEFEKSGGAAALMTRGFIDPAELQADELVFLENGFLKGENRRALHIITDELNRRGTAPAAESLAFLEQPVEMENLLEGTVTVWVDRGLKVEKGVGQLDRSIGSGFFIDKKGYILTNYHVISSEVDPEYKGFSRLYIKLSDDRGEKIPARVIGWDRHFDIALLKTEIDAPYVFSFASEDEFKLGEKIFAIGSPGGLNNTITSGTVSALGRPLQTMGETIQIDVPINPGNSGGPLMNSDSEVTGIVFAGIEDFEGVNFAIDGSYVKTLLPALYEGGALQHAWMGIGGYHGYRVLEALYTMPDSPAERAGLKRGDRILSVNGTPVEKIQDVRDLILDKMPGTLVRMNWTSDGEEVSSLLSLGHRPDVPLKDAARIDVRESLIPPVFGMVLSSVGRNQYTVEKVYTGGAADEASISANDVISIRKWYVNEKDGYFVIQFNFKGVKAGYLESAVQMGAGMESAIFF